MFKKKSTKIVKATVEKPKMNVVIEEPQLVPRRSISLTENVVETLHCHNCKHAKDLHYGSLHHQCNSRDCKCEAYK